MLTQRPLSIRTEGAFHSLFFMFHVPSLHFHPRRL